MLTVRMSKDKGPEYRGYDAQVVVIKNIFEHRRLQLKLQRTEMIRIP